jgi:hypothetical protein
MLAVIHTVPVLLPVSLLCCRPDVAGVSTFAGVFFVGLPAFLASLFFVSSSALAGVPILLTVRTVYFLKLFFKQSSQSYLHI